MNKNDLKIIGKIIALSRAGDGWVRVRTTLKPAADILQHNIWYLEHNGQWLQKHVIAITYNPKNKEFIVQLEGIEDSETATVWVGADIAISSRKLIASNFSHHQVKETGPNATESRINTDVLEDVYMDISRNLIKLGLKEAKKFLQNLKQRQRKHHGNANRNSGPGKTSSRDAHPLLKDMGGMPPTLSEEEHLLEEALDAARNGNELKLANKLALVPSLRARLTQELKHSNKLVNKLQNTNQPKFDPRPRPPGH
ncbi:MAG: hypothetical protein COB50_02375 [Thiotrichales bacterium]|nr:MAG: hypothetical protein COB50_02375 [Thiotrichales bacterium]